MFSYFARHLCATILLTVSVVANNYADELKDFRDGHVYQTIKSGSLNWFSQDLNFRKTANFSDDEGRSFYRNERWELSCPEGTRLPDALDWDKLIHDKFMGPRKVQNMKSFVSGSSMGYYKFEEDDVVNKKDYAAYYAAVGGVGTQVMMLDTKRGVAKLVRIEDADAVQVRCIYDRDLLAEKGVDKKTMLLTDNRDNKQYMVEVRAGKAWMKQNLAFSVTSEKQCYLEDKTYCEKYGRYYTYSEALKVCPVGWHLPDDGEWRDYQKERATLDWEGLGRGGCQDWDNYCDGAATGHYWSSTSILKNSARSWEFRRLVRDIDRTDASVYKGLYVRCVADLEE
ncbi:MAG: hypothetical protein IIT53_12445 [Fibrobacter sp.]|nr:hypothetical protein [Fibrobacter sp.]